MKVLILNGSPHRNGDTVSVIKKIKDRLPDDTIYEEINAYEDNIKPCNDCRYCWGIDVSGQYGKATKQKK